MKKNGLDNRQSVTIAHGFMQVWSRFDAALGKKLVKLPGNNNESRFYESNYELFYRACAGIYPQGNITMGDFSNALSVPASNATRIADLLVTKGYLKRLPDQSDRRVVRVALTDEGRDLYRAIDRYISQQMKQVLSGLSSQERETLSVLVGKVAVGLQQAAAK